MSIPGVRRREDCPQHTAELDAVRQALVADHFESFVRTLDDPLGIATDVGRDSWFIDTLDRARFRGWIRHTAFRI